MLHVSLECQRICQLGCNTRLVDMAVRTHARCMREGAENACGLTCEGVTPSSSLYTVVWRMHLSVNQQVRLYICSLQINIYARLFVTVCQCSRGSRICVHD